MKLVALAALAASLTFGVATTASASPTRVSYRVPTHELSVERPALHRVVPFRFELRPMASPKTLATPALRAHAAGYRLTRTLPKTPHVIPMPRAAS